MMNYFSENKTKIFKCSHCKVIGSNGSLIANPLCNICHQPLKEIYKEELQQKFLNRIIKGPAKFVKCSNCKAFDILNPFNSNPLCCICHQPLKEISKEEYLQKSLSSTIIRKPEKYVKCSNCRTFDLISPSIINPICGNCHQPLTQISEGEYKQKLLLTKQYLEEQKKMKLQNKNTMINNYQFIPPNNAKFKKSYSLPLNSPIAACNIIAVNFRSVDDSINYPIWGIKTDNFSTIEEKLYFEFPELRYKNIFFIANGYKINKADTLEKNKIKNGDTIIIHYN